MEFNNCKLDNNTFIEKAIVTNEGIKQLKEPHVETVVAEEAKEEQAKPVKRSNRKTQPSTHIVRNTFVYRGVNTQPERIAQLYQALLRAKWIGEETAIDDFFAVFAGEDSDVKIRWIGPQAFAHYLFKRMLEREYITYPEGVPHQPWVIVQSHFVDKDRRIFTNWNKKRTPSRQRLTLDAVADILA